MRPTAAAKSKATHQSYCCFLFQARDQRRDEACADCCYSAGGRTFGAQASPAFCAKRS
jgi:hypothetical protein